MPTLDLRCAVAVVSIVIVQPLALNKLFDYLFNYILPTSFIFLIHVWYKF